jgi:hypothetical protein
MKGEQIVKLVVSHRVGLAVACIGLIATVDIGNDFPDRPILELAQRQLELGSDLDYFGAPEAAVVMVESARARRCRFFFFNSSTTPTGSSTGIPNMAERITS